MSEETKEIQVQDTEKQVAETEAERTRDRLAFVPRADIYETDEAIYVVADMPGVDESSLDITLEKGVLTLNGTVEPEAPEGYSLAYAEYRVGDYTRSFSLSNEIDQGAIEATLKDGVLRLTLPKVTEAQTRKIAVKAG
jgi:HSP20 family molecular chaperone IbpA